MVKKIFTLKKSKFEFTKSEKRDCFNMYSEIYKYGNIINGSPETIAIEFGKILENTLNSMECNEATKLTMCWKWE